MQEEYERKNNPLKFLGKKLIGVFHTENSSSSRSRPNSLFIPFRMIRAVNNIPGTFYRSHRIQVVLSHSSLIICQNRHAEGGDTYSWWTGKWHEDFVAFLKIAAAANLNASRRESAKTGGRQCKQNATRALHNADVCVALLLPGSGRLRPVPRICLPGAAGSLLPRGLGHA